MLKLKCNLILCWWMLQIFWYITQNYLQSTGVCYLILEFINSCQIWWINISLISLIPILFIHIYCWTYSLTWFLHSSLWFKVTLEIAWWVPHRWYFVQSSLLLWLSFCTWKWNIIYHAAFCKASSVFILMFHIVDTCLYFRLDFHCPLRSHVIILATFDTTNSSTGRW